MWSGLRRKRLLWLSLSVVASLAMASVVVREGIGAYVVQDDARQHVFWMQRFSDRDLFPNDLIADYFQSVAPAGYTALYRAASMLGLDPFSFNKLLPPILAVVATVFAFGATVQLFPVPWAGFCTAIIFNLSLWMKDDLVSGTPRAFVYPLLTAFLYFLLRRKTWSVALSVVATGLFYPQYVLVEAGVLALYGVEFPRFRLRRSAIALALVGCMAAVLVLLPFVFATNEFGPVVTLQQAQQLADFYPKGRSAFFYADSFYFWLSGDRSGLLPGRTPLALWIGALLPVLLKFKKQFFDARKLHQSQVLLQLFVSALSWFLLAHLFLFKLHLPSRYTHHSFRVLFAIASGITIVILVQEIWRLSLQFKGVYRILGQTISVALLFSVLASPIWLSDSFRTAYHEVAEVELYDFLKTTPKDSVVAGIDGEVNNIPTFSQRSILVGMEYAIPYHRGYYEIIKKRAIDLIRAHYSSDLYFIQKIVKSYDIDYWVVAKNDFSEAYLEQNYWLEKIEESKMKDDPLVRAVADVFESVKAGQMAALQSQLDRCSVFESNRFVVLESNCIVGNSPQRHRGHGEF
ncbi:hypothetical protein POG22_03815 [Geitlerinema sp. CS-897]|nr:hypothetical protein [Geitlerinema sp. CS-897]